MLSIADSNAVKLRKMIIDMAHKSKESHIGSALSIVEIMYAIYFRVSNITKENIKSPSRDKVIVSKGHAGLAQYAALALKEIIPKDKFETYAQNGGCIPAYICKRACDGIEVSTGMSLGHGLGIAEGFALANRLDGIKSRIFVVIGDGEMQEGSIWEALNSIIYLNLSEITVVLDKNNMQASAETKDIIDNSNLGDRLALMGFSVKEVNGHNVDELENALKMKTDKPLIVIANTIKGCGLKEYENTVKSHYIEMDDECYNMAVSALEEMGK